MRDFTEVQALYEQGIYTFGEAVTAVVCEADERSPAVLAPELSARFLEGVAELVASVPGTATAADIVVFKSSRAHAEMCFRGIVKWRAWFAAQEATSRR